MIELSIVAIVEWLQDDSEHLPIRATFENSIGKRAKNGEVIDQYNLTVSLMKSENTEYGFCISDVIPS